MTFVKKWSLDLKLNFVETCERLDYTWLHTHDCAGFILSDLTNFQNKNQIPHKIQNNVMPSFGKSWSLCRCTDD